MSSDGPGDRVITDYCALYDTLKHAGIANTNGKLIPKRGQSPEVANPKALCLYLLRE